MNENVKETTLREATKSIYVEGYLKEVKLEEKVNEQRVSYISGSITITDSLEGEKTNDVRINYYVSQYKKGTTTEISAFKGLRTVMMNNISLAKAKAENIPLDQVSKVSVYSAFNERYVKERDTYYRSLQSMNPPKTVTGDFKPRATFETEFFLEGIRPEMKNDVETGRAIINTIIPVYGGKVVRWDFIAEPTHANYINTYYEVGKTSKISGNIINSVEEKTVTTTGFGGEMTNVIRNYINEYVIVNGEQTQFDETDSRSFSVEAIKKALIERENAEKEVVQKAPVTNGFATTPNSGFGFGVGMTSPVNSPVNW